MAAVAVFKYVKDSSWSSPVWLVVLRAENGYGEGNYKGAGLAHQQEELSVK